MHPASSFAPHAVRFAPHAVHSSRQPSSFAPHSRCSHLPYVSRFRDGNREPVALKGLQRLLPPHDGVVPVMVVVERVQQAVHDAPRQEIVAYVQLDDGPEVRQGLSDEVPRDVGDAVGLHLNRAHLGAGQSAGHDRGASVVAEFVVGEIKRLNLARACGERCLRC